MKNALKAALGLLLLLGGALVIAATTLSPEYEVTRTIAIDGDASCAFGHVNDVTKHDAWSPFSAMEPTLEISYGAITEGPGASYDWHGDMGDGRLTILDSVENASIESLVWSPDMGDTAELWTFEQDGDHTVVSWSYSGSAPGSTGGLRAAAMDPMLGPIFEDGLARLKALCTP